MISPTQRTMAHLKKLGYDAAVVERWNPYAKIRQDLFGFADIVALSCSTVLIQTTSGSNHAARKAKIEANKVAQNAVMYQAAKVEIWSWSKKGARGKRKLWSLRRERLSRDCDEWRWNEVPG